MTVRLAGHALTVEWSGERGAESSSTGYCRCGWSESASSQHEVRFEYRMHLRRLLQGQHEWNTETDTCRICGVAYTWDVAVPCTSSSKKGSSR